MAITTCPRCNRRLRKGATACDCATAEAAPAASTDHLPLQDLAPSPLTAESGTPPAGSKRVFCGQCGTDVTFGARVRVSSGSWRCTTCDAGARVQPADYLAPPTETTFQPDEASHHGNAQPQHEPWRHGAGPPPLSVPVGPGAYPPPPPPMMRQRGSGRRWGIAVALGVLLVVGIGLTIRFWPSSWESRNRMQITTLINAARAHEANGQREGAREALGRVNAIIGNRAITDSTLAADVAEARAAEERLRQNNAEPAPIDPHGQDQREAVAVTEREPQRTERTQPTERNVTEQSTVDEPSDTTSIEDFRNTIKRGSQNTRR